MQRVIPQHSPGPSGDSHLTFTWTSLFPPHSLLLQVNQAYCPTVSYGHISSPLIHLEGCSWLFLPMVLTCTSNLLKLGKMRLLYLPLPQRTVSLLKAKASLYSKIPLSLGMMSIISQGIDECFKMRCSPKHGSFESVT